MYKDVWPLRFVVVDTETIPDPARSRDRSEYHVFSLGYMYLCEHNGTDDYNLTGYRLETTEDFWRVLDGIERKRDCINVYAHNMGFDLRALCLIPRIKSGSYSLWPAEDASHQPKNKDPFVVLENPPTMIRVFRSDNQVFMFTDTVQLFFQSIKALGVSIGLPKLEDPGEEVDREKRFEYCIRDVDILTQYLIKHIKYIKIHRLGNVKPTLASQAMEAYKVRFIQNRHFPHTNKDAWILERESYYGGRTDCWRLGEVTGPVYQYDANSLYPSMMTSHKYPVEMLSHETYKELKPPSIITDAAGTIARVRIRADAGEYPIRAVGGTYFCQGYFDTTLAGPELSRALRLGHVVGVLERSVYRLASLFERYVGFFWSQKTHCTNHNLPAEREIAKRLLVSLYGKFGQLSPVWEETEFEPDEPDALTGTLYNVDSGETRKWRRIADLCQIDGDPDIHKSSFIPIASYVTAYGRDYMYKLREIAGSKEVYYQATDSLFVSETGRANLDRGGHLDEKRMGKLKHVSTFNAVNFISIHRYDADDKRVRGSVRSGSREVDANRFECLKFEGCRVALGNGNDDGIYIRPIIKVLNGKYSRGLVGGDNWTYPYVLNAVEYRPNLDRPTDPTRKLLPIQSLFP